MKANNRCGSNKLIILLVNQPDRAVKSKADSLSRHESLHEFPAHQKTVYKT